MLTSYSLITSFVILNFIQVYFTAECIQCSKLPPGIEKITKGVDITKLDLVPLKIGGNSGIRSPIVSFTCDEGKKWKNSKGTEYQLPDQIWQLTTLPGGWLSADVHLYKTDAQIRKSLTWNVGLGGGIEKFAFSASASYKSMQNTITNTSSYISDVGAFESATRADLIPSWVLRLDQFTQMFLDRSVKGTFETNPSGYNNFIDNFGTHYFSKANFGGFIRVIMKTKTDYFYSRSDRDVTASAKLSFLQYISAHGGVVSKSTAEDKTFTNSTTSTVRYYGGNTNLLDKGGILAWQPTVANNPWHFSGEVKPISELIKDSTKKLSMERAVENYVLRSYLDELQRLITFAKTKSNDPVLTRLQTRLTQMKSMSVLILKEVDLLGQEVESNIKVPSWFMTSTNLCFKWWADGDAKQCGGGAASLLCARPNTMTPVYKDYTDNRRGGCRMQWGIQSSSQPSWFNDVNVCFTWKSDGNKDQCGGGASRMLCAGVNKFSPPYLDDTDSRSGGCMMSWKLDVIQSAPLWLRTAKLCFS